MAAKTMNVHAKENLYEKAKGLEDSGYGEYKEGMGGGTPVGLRSGNKPYEKEEYNGRDGYDRAGRPGKRGSQPRTEDGQFTFNSVNGKGLSKKSDPTRNHTVNPLLTGGENNISQEEFEKQMEEGKGEYFDKFCDIALVSGGKYVFRGQVYNIDRQTMIQELQKIGSGQISEGRGKVEAKGYDVEVKAKQKMGRKSKEEKEFIDKNKMAFNVMRKMDENSSEYLTKRPQGYVIKESIKVKIERKDIDQFIKRKISESKAKKAEESKEQLKEHTDFSKFDF